MLEDFGIALETTSMVQYIMALFGGFLFGSALFYIRPKSHGWGALLHYNNYVMSALLMFYVTFPFAQGLLGYLEDGSAVRLISISLTYLVYVIGFALATCINWFIEKRAKDA